MAQQTTAPSSARAPAAAPQNAPQPTQHARAQHSAPPLAAPTTMDQVVDRAIVREHALITFLQTRTPLVETYLAEPEARSSRWGRRHARTTTSSAVWT